MRYLWILILCLTFSPAPLRGQTQPASAPATSAATTADTTPAQPQTPEQFFARARELSDLEAAGIPFHLKATFVATGDTEVTGKGTIEEWRESKDIWRKEATLGDYQWVSIGNGKKLDLYATSNVMPLCLVQALNAVLVRIPAHTGDSDHWKLQYKKLSGMNMAVLSNQYGCTEVENKSNVVAQCIQQDYFTTWGILRVRREGMITTAYNEIQPFQSSLLVPRKIEVFIGTTPTLSVFLQMLEPLSMDGKTVASITAIPSDPRLIHHNYSPGKLTVSSGVMARRILRQVQPRYPVEARQQRIQGTVVMSAIIDENGTVQNLRVVQSAGTLLDDAALQAVRQWQYQPTILAGTPVKVNTTINVVFTLNY